MNRRAGKPTTKKTTQLVNVEEHVFPDYDIRLFSRACDFLAVGARADRYLNNRVDAINYSIAHRLNQSIESTGTKYYMVSNAPTMKKLDCFIAPEFGLHKAARYFADGMIMTARAASMHQILLSAGGSPAGAERIAYIMLLDLANYNAQLARLKSPTRSDRASFSQSASAENLLNTMLHSFNVFQKQIDHFREKQNDRLKLFNIEYRKRDPSDFYAELTSNVERILDRSGYSKSIDEWSGSERTLIVAPTGKLRPFTFRQSYEFRLPGDQGVAAFARLYKDHVAFFAISDAPVNEFIRTVDLAYSSLVSNLTKGKYRRFAGGRNERVHIGVEGRSVLQLDFKRLDGFSLEAISKAADALPSEISFLRVDFSHFSVSFEGDVVAFTSNQRCIDEATLFVDELVEPEFKNRNMRSAIESVFSDWLAGGRGKPRRKGGAQ